MRRHCSTLLILCICLSCTPARATEVRRAEAVARAPESRRDENPPGINDAARFIAGLPVTGSGPLAEWTKTPEWISFSSAMNQKWERFKLARLSRIRPWANSHLSDLDAGTVFYPIYILPPLFPLQNNTLVVQNRYLRSFCGEDKQAMRLDPSVLYQEAR